MNGIKHNCGIVGIHSETEVNIPELLFYPLFSLQHRGQESCGISYNKKTGHATYKDLGMVGQVLSRYLSENHPSKLGIGHVRYSTAGRNRIENSAPISIKCNKGEISLVHNGNISNSTALHRALSGEGSIFQSETDSELILHLLARSERNNFMNALKDSLLKLEGAFNLIMLHNESLIAIRDPDGFRPLIVGKKNGLTVFGSETCALDILQIQDRREVKPGEIIIIDRKGMRSERYTRKQKMSQCIFELIYFARPDSKIFGYSVHIARERMGSYLIDGDLQNADIVISVPDSGNSAAFGYAHASGIPFEMGLTRNHYTGRTFIQPTTYLREFAVRMKLHPIRESIQGKRVVLIDDSLVRGTTAKIIVKLLKENGAREVHLRLSSPQIRHPCFFGIDIPTKGELISRNNTADEIAKQIGADSVRFLALDRLKQCVQNPHDFCFACFSGEYPIDIQRND